MLFVGIGAVGTVLVDMIFFNQPFTPTKLILIIILIAGIIGLNSLLMKMKKEVNNDGVDFSFNSRKLRNTRCGTTE